jgi:uncharacterized membrane protein
VTKIRPYVALLAALMAAPVLAQSAPPPASNTEAASQRKAMVLNRGAFANMSDAGRATMREAMRAQHDPGHWEKLRTARDRVSAVLAAERLDVAALKRAMDEERQLADSQQARRQAAMLEAFQKLSVADRQAFAADAGKSRERIENRVRIWREGQPKDSPKS